MKSKLLAITLALAAALHGQTGTVAPDGTGITSATRDAFLGKLGAKSPGIAILRMSAPGNDMLMAWNGSGVLTPIPKSTFITGSHTHAFADITGKPTSLSGYGITISNGEISLAKLATDPLARANHTGTQSYTTITGLGTLATQSGTFSGSHSGTSTGTNSGDQTSIVGITGSKANFDTAATDGNFLWVSDIGASVLAPNGDGSGLTNLPAPFDQSLNTTDRATFHGTQVSILGVPTSFPAVTATGTSAQDGVYSSTTAGTAFHGVSSAGNLIDLSGASGSFVVANDGTVTAPEFAGNTTGVHTGNVIGTSDSAVVLLNGRTFSATGDATGTSAAFDGSAAASIPLTVGKINGVSMAGLATGILKNTTGTGVPSIAVAGTDYMTPSGVSAAYQPLDAALTALAGGSDFVVFSGPSSSVKTFALPNASATILTTNAAVTTGQGGLGADNSASSGVPLFATGTVTMTGTSGTGNFARVTSPTFVTPALGTPSSGNGVNITDLNATQLTTGTVPLGRLSGITPAQTSGLAPSAVVAEFDYSTTTSGLGITGSSGSWSYTLPAGATALEIVTVSAGGGGGSGRRGATSTARSGGGGGAGGSVTRISIPVASLPSSTLAVTVGAGGTGGTAITADDTNGNPGGLGGDTLIVSSGSTVCKSFAAASAGGGGTATTASGGVAWSVGGTEIGPTGGIGQSTGSVSSSGAGGPVTPGAGGGGGGVTSANVFIAGADPGVNGGLVWGGVSNSVRGYNDGANRNATNATVAYAWSPVGGGGGGGAGSVANAGGTGGNAVRGGGGGGGGASVNGQSSGAGGNGGNGFVRIVVRF